VTGDHEAFDELAVGWALHALEPEDEATFTAHLAGCNRCARTVAETVEVMASLAGELPGAEPSAELGVRLRGAVERTEQLPPEPPAPSSPAATGFPGYDDERVRLPEAPRPAWRRALPALLAAAAVALIVALGVWNVFLADSRSQAEAAAAAQARIIDRLLIPGRATITPVSDRDGHRLATVVARDSDIQVVTDGLDVNDVDDTTYVVWGMGGDHPVALGVFDVVHSQIDLRNVGSTASGLDDYPAYGISLEPGRQAPAAPTDVVATGEATR
jgi:anti-sigma-K factor RskA